MASWISDMVAPSLSAMRSPSVARWRKRRAIQIPRRRSWIRFASLAMTRATDITNFAYARGWARAIGLDQALGVDFGVDLRGRQRGVAEQFLDRAHVAAARQQMRGERMPQRMRRRGLGQPERAAQPRHGELHDARRQRAAFGADEQRARVRADRRGRARRNRRPASRPAAAAAPCAVCGPCRSR